MNSLSPSATDSLRVGILHPGRAPEFVGIANSLQAQQDCVGGDLELWAIDGHVAILCHEEGRLLGLPYNRQITLEDGTSERFVGPILLVGWNEDTGDHESLTDADIAIWTRRLLHPTHPEIRERTNYQRLNRDHRTSTIHLAFDSNTHLTDASARAWARAIARDWGDIQQETRFRVPDFDGWIGAFSCSGHGGYVVITAESRPQWKPFAQAGHLLTAHPGFHGVTSYQFEEDSDWAVLESDLPGLAEMATRKRLQIQSHSAWVTPEQQATAQTALRNPQEFQAILSTHLAHMNRALSLRNR